jgi:plasmid stabilization system protein ParE
MNLPLIVRPAAEADIREIHEYLENVRSGLGGHFSARLRDVLEQIEVSPEGYGIVWNDVRAVRVRKFQYVVYYVVLSDGVEVLAVLHGARQESTWKSRVE